MFGPRSYVVPPAWCLTAASLQIFLDSSRTIGVRHLYLTPPVQFSSSPPWRTVTNNKNPLNQNINIQESEQIRAPLSGCLKEISFRKSCNPFPDKGRSSPERFQATPRGGIPYLSVFLAHRWPQLLTGRPRAPELRTVDRPFGGVGLER